MWERLHAVFPAAIVTIEIAIVGLIVSWLQLRYMQQRDRDIDTRDGWTQTHRMMMTFRFKRELLNDPNLAFPQSAEAARVALESLHNLKGQLDRMPDGPLVKQMAEFLHANQDAGRWRSHDFEKPFDDLAKQAAYLARPATNKW
jgi:hypothetical protein